MHVMKTNALTGNLIRGLQPYFFIYYKFISANILLNWGINVNINFSCIFKPLTFLIINWLDANKLYKAVNINTT